MLYHAVGSRVPNDTYGISVEPKRFERQMELLAQQPDINLVPFDRYESMEGALKVAVTFDDGYKDNLYQAAPVLLKWKIPFTVFVVSSFLGRDSCYLTPSELRELAALPGATIGSHGATHLPLAECSDTTLSRELAESRLDLENIIGLPVTTIAYPHGSANLRVRGAAALAGYKVGGCSRFDINDELRDPLLLCRSEVVASDSDKVFLQKLNGSWDWYRWRRRDPAGQ
jgi:peptidoglycan/xylan/chitin deacetylase (PgdA/CDA1 family)